MSESKIIVSYKTKKISWLSRLWKTGRLVPQVNCQLKEIVFESNSVKVVMMNGDCYKLERGKFRTVNQLSSKDKNCLLRIEMQENEVFEIFGVSGELEKQEWKDIKERLNCLYKVRYRT